MILEKEHLNKTINNALMEMYMGNFGIKILCKLFNVQHHVKYRTNAVVLATTYTDTNLQGKR